jgi:CO/xanthine dehydrogenase Mo-binding subunit
MTFTHDARVALDRSGVSRRRFLERSGVLVVGFAASDLIRPLGTGPDVVLAQAAPANTQVDAWIAVSADGVVTAYTGKCELGQGLQTVQMQLIAEELAVPLDRVRLIQCDTASTPDQGTTSGSQSHPTNFNRANLAQAAATARETLVQLASASLGLPADQLHVAGGAVFARANPAKQVTYGALLGGKRFNVAVNRTAARRPPNTWSVMGTSAPRVDLPALVTGQLEFVHNLRVPGMVHGVVCRPREVGAVLSSVNERSVQGMPGLIKVVVRRNFVGVVAEKPWQAIQAAGRLAISWTPGVALPPQAGFYEFMRRQPSRDALVVDSGDVDRRMQEAAAVVTATYLHPYQMHGSVGSSCAVADVAGERATIWSSTQAAYPLRSASARLLGLRTENVRVVFMRGSGCYGINGADTVAYDAALLSQAAGRPVRVQLSRSDEMTWENYGLAYVVDQRAALDSAGDVVAWDCESWSPTLGGRPGYDTPGNVITGMLAGFEPAAFAPRAPAPPPTTFNNGSNAAPSYVTGCVGGSCGGTGRVRSERVLTHTIRSPFFTGPLRSPNRLQNTFAHESFMDEIAAQVKADPIAYRLRHLQDRRLIDVVNAAAKAAGWQPRPSPAPGRSPTGVASGRGFACVLYEGDNGYCAIVAEVDVDQESGRLSVRRLVSSQDCGPISSPDGMRNQIEGGALQGLSRALGEEVTWDDRKVTSVDWRSYHSLTLGMDVPRIESVLINRPDEEASGAGETTITLVAAAIGNAIFDATGARVRQVPFTPERVKAAIDARRRG